MTADGNIPVAFRCTDDNTSDSRTHIGTWNTLRALAGRSDFPCVANTKLCSRENMDHIDRGGGRFITVLPRNRQEDAGFRQWIQTNNPDWTCVRDRPNPRHTDGQHDCWYVFRAQLLSAEVWPVLWVSSPSLTLRQEARRRRHITASIEEFQQLRARLVGSKTRLRGVAKIDLQIKVILEKDHVARYLTVRCTVREEHEYRQTRWGRPGPEAAHRKITGRRLDIEWTTDKQAIAYDHSSDGMYPLITNVPSLSPAQVLKAHKGQSMIEKRFEQVETKHEIAPVFLKDGAASRLLHAVLPRSIRAGAH